MANETLTERRVYGLPDDTWVIAIPLDGAWLLYSYREWKSGETEPRLRLAPDGRVVERGAVTPWTVRDLFELPVRVGEGGRAGAERRADGPRW